MLSPKIFISLPNDKQQQVKSLCSRKVLDDWNTHNAVLHFIHSYKMCLDTFASEILGVHQKLDFVSDLTFQIPQLGSLACVKVTDPRKAKTYQVNLALTPKDSEDANQATQAFRGSRQFSFQLHPAPQSQRLYPTGPALGRVATWWQHQGHTNNLLGSLGSLADKRKYAPLGSDLGVRAFQNLSKEMDGNGIKISSTSRAI